jgi:hypothetical protein
VPVSRWVEITWPSERISRTIAVLSASIIPVTERFPALCETRKAVQERASDPSSLPFVGDG